MPMPFFSRGANLGKLGAFLLLFPIGPLVYFLMRRDRAICAFCHKTLPAPGLGALTFNVPLALNEPDLVIGEGANGEVIVRGTSEALRAIGPDDQAPSADELVEIAWHERTCRMSQRRTVALVAAAGLAVLTGGISAARDEAMPAALLFGLGGLAGAVAYLSARRGHRHGIAAQARRQRLRVLQVLDLARAGAGRLSPTAVARELHLDQHEAEALLDSMVDGKRVDVELDEGGHMTYVFSELAA